MIHSTDEQLAAAGWRWAHRSRSGDGSKLLGVTVSPSDAALWIRMEVGTVVALQHVQPEANSEEPDNA